MLTLSASSGMHVCSVGVTTTLFTVGHLVHQPLLLIASLLVIEMEKGWEMDLPDLPNEDASVAQTTLACCSSCLWKGYYSSVVLLSDCVKL